MATCLVTGGAGFIGSHIVEALLARGDQVRVLDNLSGGKLENLSGVADQIEFIQGDIRDVGPLQQAMANVDFVFHLAALVSVQESMVKPAETEAINTIGTVKVLHAARETGAQCVVLSSTSAVYGDEPTLPNVETTPPQPTASPYAISKLAAEHYCKLFYKSFGLRTVLLRYFNVFGPRQDPSSPYSGVISIFVDLLSRGIVPTVFGDGEQTRDFVFVKDVAQANLRAIEVSEVGGQVFNIGTGYQVSINQLFQDLCRVFNCKMQPNYAPARAGDIIHSYADMTRTQTVLDWRPEVSLEEGLRELVNSSRK